MMNEIKNMFNLEKKEDGSVAVKGRELHEGLEVKERYNDWAKRMIAYGFDENVDYFEVTEKTVTSHGRKHDIKNHVMTLDMAKQIAMIQRSEIGKQIRQYFIAVENQYKQQKPLTPLEQIQLLAQGTSELNERIETVESEITDIRENSKLEQGEYSAITRAVNDKVAQQRYALGLDRSDKQANTELFRDINNEIKRVANVATRSQIRQKDFSNVMELIRLWQPSQATVFLIKK